MCGIVGAMGLQDRDLVRSMMDAVRHRGPDDSGFYVGDGVSLGHMRLSIIDLSARGRQPMGNEDGTIQITYNGEVFNYRQLRAELEAAGHTFLSDTDTECLVHGYEEWGLGFVRRLRGQFAFGLWDGLNRRLVLCRDRAGILPLYYAELDGIVLFASELKALLRYEPLKPRLDYRALDNYLTFQYVPEPDTILEGVRKLEPAHMRVWDREGVRDVRYWDLDIGRVSDLGEAECVRELTARLTDSVRARLASDVPLGVHLSGGIDSSAITAVAASLIKEPVRTFSIGYGHDEVDELKHARLVAEHLGTDHHEIVVGADEVLGELEEVVWHLDEPNGDPAQIPEYFLAKHTKRHVSVVFNGGGADEVFGGYRAYRYMAAAERLRRSAPGPLRRAMRPLRNLPMPARHRRYVDYVSSGDEDRIYWGQGLMFGDLERGKLYSAGLCARTAGNDPALMIKRHFDEKAPERPGMLNLLSYVDLKGWVPGNCLSKLDRVMMAHAVEARVPYLDHLLVEYAMTIPPHLKLKGGVEKHILRKAMAGRLPEAITKRPKKGFGVPTNHWLFRDVNDAVSERLMKSRFIRECFRPERVRFLAKGTRDYRHSSQLYGLLVLDMWHERYLGGR